MLRLDLEIDLLEGKVAVKDLPKVWNERFNAYLGVTPPDDRDGCLQDIHWYDGAWGYFPTYTLGAMAAAQLYAAAKKADPGIVPGIRRGEFAPLMAWLKRNVHGKGSLMTTDELMAEATGEPLSDRAFRAHLKARYFEGEG